MNLPLEIMHRFFGSWFWLLVLLTLAAVLPWLVGGPARPNFPSTLGSLVLRKTIAGPEAAAIVNRMHGRPVAQGWNGIGYYQSGRSGAMLYLSIYADAAEAREGAVGMGRKLRSGAYGFHGYRTFVVDGRTVAVCTGLGQVHFIFTDRQSLYWLAVHPQLADEAFTSLLASLR